MARRKKKAKKRRKALIKADSWELANRVCLARRAIKIGWKNMYIFPSDIAPKVQLAKLGMLGEPSGKAEPQKAKEKKLLFWFFRFF